MRHSRQWLLVLRDRRRNNCNSVAVREGGSLVLAWQSVNLRSPLKLILVRCAGFAFSTNPVKVGHSSFFVLGRLSDNRPKVVSVNRFLFFSGGITETESETFPGRLLHKKRLFCVTYAPPRSKARHSRVRIARHIIILLYYTPSIALTNITHGRQATKSVRGIRQCVSCHESLPYS